MTNKNTNVYRQPIISVLGHVDSGKCVTGDMKIKIESDYMLAKDLYKLIDDNEVISSLSLDIHNLSLVRSRFLTAVKLDSNKIVDIELHNGLGISTTPEHSFLIYRGKGIFQYIKAVDLSVGDYLVGEYSGTSITSAIPVHTIFNIKYEESSQFNIGVYRVNKVRLRHGSYNVYDFEVEDFNNFVIENVIVHNTTLLDKIRGTAVQLREAGGITQHIGASLFPKETLKAIAGELLSKYRFQLKVPGLLVIDTPGHEVFTNLRKRGGSAADIAILVVDIMRGFEPQTHESIQILMSRKVPFLVAANKVDMLHGWKSQPTLSILESLKKQNEEVIYQMEEKLAYIVSALNTYKFDADRFDRVRDFSKTVTIIPVSAKTGEGIRELITILIGLVHRFMLDQLKVDLNKPGYGVVLEVSKEVGLGTVLKSIHIDGIVRVGDALITAGSEGPIISRIRTLLLPAPLDEIRDPRHKFKPIKESYPASGILISAPNIDDTYAGSPFYSVTKEEDVALYKNAVLSEVMDIKIDTEKIGVVVKADTLGSLEAIINHARRRGIPIRKADVGPISKKDVVEADIVKNIDENRGVVLGFNVNILSDAEEYAQLKKIPIFRGDILYRIIDEYLDWVAEEADRKKKRLFEGLMKPGKIQVLEGFIFRRSKPAIFGIRVLAGVIKQKYPLINSEGRKVGRIHQIQDRGKNISEAVKDMEVAISIREAVIGRDIYENDILYVDLPETDTRLLMKEFYDMLSADERDALHETIDIKRKSNPAWVR